MKKVLYLGTDPSNLKCDVFHYPVIKTVPKELSKEIIEVFEHLNSFSHCIFTSKNGVRVFFEFLKIMKKELPSFSYLSVGKVTTQALLNHGIVIEKIQTAKDERQEGIIELLEKVETPLEKILLPRSSKSRALLREYLNQKSHSFVDLPLYDTVYQTKLPTIDLKEVETIIFTSPSTAHAFYRLFPKLPEGVCVVVQGPVTKKVVEKLFNPHSVFFHSSKCRGQHG